jgi:tetratricopeptide (TPR) repeat protein
MGTMSRFAILTAALMVLTGFAAFLSATGFFSGTGDVDLAKVPAVESETDRAISRLQQRLADSPEDGMALNDLGTAYLQKARESGDPTFYGKADGVFQKALAIDSRDQSALIGASAVAAERHDFALALDFAQRAIELDPNDADANGALGDALIELGRYDEALAAFQSMLDTRPDLNAYVRISYARELHGDLDGAVAAMKLAIEAARPSGETAAWVHSQLGNVYFNRGKLRAAGEEYEVALSAFPGHIHAIAGLARISAAQEDYDRAIELYGQVIDRQPVLEHIAALGDVYRAQGQEAEAARQYDLVAAIDALYRSSGVSTDLEMALFLADHGIGLEEAVAIARRAYESQRGSIRAADALAWVLHKAGNSDDAANYVKEAVRLGTQDPLILFHAGAISHAIGDDETARAYLTQVAEGSPRFSVLHAEEAASLLQDLNVAVRSEQ